MSFNKDKNELNDKMQKKLINSELEKDDMNIKSHLNASLDLSGISVSEDLINRTLEAIKQQGTGPDAELKVIAVKETVHKETAKKTGSYIRRFAGAAAALLVVTTGIYFINNVKPKFMFDLTSNSVQENSTADSAESKTASNPTEEAATGSSDNAAAKKATGAENSDTVQQFTVAANAPDISVTVQSTASDQEAGASTSGSSQDTSAASTKAAAKSAATEPAKEAADTAKEDSVQRGLVAGTTFDLGATEDTAGGGGGSDNNGASQGTGSDNGDTSLNENAMVTTSKTYFFTNIFLKVPEQAQYVKITQASDQDSVTMTTAEDIQNFYTFMELSTFTDRTDACTAPVSYTIEVKSLQPEEDTYTMTIADGITVTCDTGETVGQSLYNTGDIALFTKNLGEFFEKYRSESTIEN